MLLLNSSAMVTESTLFQKPHGTDMYSVVGNKRSQIHSSKEVIQEVSQCRNSRSQLLRTVCFTCYNVFEELSPRE